MIAQLEHVYRLLDLPESVDSAAVRQAFGRLMAGLQAQHDAAGSRPERLIARQQIKHLAAQEKDVERLAAALEVGEHLAEARAAIAARRGARAARALGYATQAAGKAGLDGLAREVADAQDEFADSGLARDAAFAAEIDDLESQVAEWERAIGEGAAGGAAPPDAPAASLASFQALVASLSRRGESRADAASRDRLAALNSRLETGSAAFGRWRADHACREGLARAQALRERFGKALADGERARAQPDELAAAVAEIDVFLVDELGAPDPPADPALIAERQAARVALQQLRAGLSQACEQNKVLLGLEALEKEAEGGAFAEGFEKQIADVDQAAAKAGISSAISERLAALRARIEESKRPPATPPPLPAAEAVKAATRQAAPAVTPPEPVPADRFTLVGPEGERCHVICRDRIVFGRSRSCDVILRAYHPADKQREQRVSESISRRQFVIEKEEDDVVLRDGGPGPDGEWQSSANETFGPDGVAIGKVRLFRAGLTSLAIIRNAAPVTSPQWDVQLQMRADLPAGLAALRDALPLGPDALFLRRTDGACEDVLVVWRAASLQPLGLTDTPVYLLRQGAGFLLAQDDQLIGLETGFRVGKAWSVASLGKFTFRT